MRIAFSCRLFLLLLFIYCGATYAYAQNPKKNVVAAGAAISTIPLLSGEADGGWLSPVIEYERLTMPGRKRSVFCNVGYHRPGMALKGYAGTPLGRYDGPTRAGFALIGFGLRHYAGGIDKRAVRYFFGALLQTGIGSGPSGAVRKDGEPEKQFRYFAGLAFLNGLSVRISNAVRAKIEAHAGMGTDNGIGYYGDPLGPRLFLGAGAMIGYRF